MKKLLLTLLLLSNAAFADNIVCYNRQGHIIYRAKAPLIISDGKQIIAKYKYYSDVLMLSNKNIQCIVKDNMYAEHKRKGRKNQERIFGERT